MTTETTFRADFWVLVVGLMVMRTYLIARFHAAGERMMPDRTAVAREGGWLFVVRVLLFFSLLAGVGVYVFNPPGLGRWLVPLPDWLRWIGFAVAMASLGLWTWAQATLGVEWSPQLRLREGHRLVTAGPYSRVRHPLYTAMFGYMAGLALVTANAVFAVLAAIVIAGFMARVPKEEQMMIVGFGDEYRAYMQRTGRFFPK
jgi:protein-S-isoprenylcysteine O-methyltransferase Ste14